jgi:hypothetical protein
MLKHGPGEFFPESTQPFRRGHDNSLESRTGQFAMQSWPFRGRISNMVVRREQIVLFLHLVISSFPEE